MNPAERPYVPDVGDTFEIDRGIFDGRYRVSSWLRPSRVWEVTPAGDCEVQGWVPDPDPFIEEMRLRLRSDFPMRGVSADNLPLTWCRREEATHISGVGVAGIILHVYEVVVDGRVPWDEKYIDEERRHAELLIGERLS